MRHAAAALAACLWAAPAHAVRPFVTDDARIIDPGQIEMEIWGEMGRYEGDLTPGVHGMFGVSVNEWFELIVGNGYNRNTTRGRHHPADPII